MNCPKCKKNMQILDSRKHGAIVRRRRKCTSCGNEERTIEVFGDCPTSVDGWIKDRTERDRAIGALGVLVYDGIITAGRMRELLEINIYQQQEELARLLAIGERCNDT